MVSKFSEQIHFYYHYPFQQKKVDLDLRRRNIILFGIPTYNNIADEAIAIAENKYLYGHFPEVNIIEIEEKKHYKL